MGAESFHVDDLTDTHDKCNLPILRTRLEIGVFR